MKDKEINPPDIMTSIRRLERKGLVYVRGYRTGYGETPFEEGFLLTWLDPSKPREKAIEEAIQRTEIALVEKSNSSPTMQRIHVIRDQIIEASKLNDLVSFEFLQNKLSCSEYELETALKRAMQLYPEIREVKLFNRFKTSFFLSKLNEHQKIIYEILGERKKMLSGELYRGYCKLVKNPVVDRAYRNYMKRMIESGLVKVEGKGRWKSYEIIA